MRFPRKPQTDYQAVQTFISGR